MCWRVKISWSNSNGVFSQNLHVVDLVCQEIFSWDYCIVLYHIILYCTVVNCIVQYSIILYITLLCTIVIHWCAGRYMVLQLKQRYNTLQFSVIQYNSVQYNTIQYSIVEYSAMQYNAVKYNTIQFSTVQYSTIVYDRVKYCT